MQNELLRDKGTQASLPVSNNSPPLISAVELSKTFPVKAGLFSASQTVLRAVSKVTFSIPAGKTLGLVGESGCGKTTTARSLLRIIEPDSGTLFFDLKDEQRALLPRYHELRALHDPSPSAIKELASLEKRVNLFRYEAAQLRTARLAMQYVFQDPYGSLNPKMHVGDIITEAARENLHLTRRERNALSSRLLDQVGLSAQDSTKYPHEFSGGQRQRINIARAIALKPKFLVCDEPVSSLDVSIQSQILNLLLDLQAEHGMTYLFIAHNMNVVFFMSDEVAVMYAGRIVEQGPSKVLSSGARHPYTRLLLSVAARSETVQSDSGELPDLTKDIPGCPFAPRCSLVQEKCRHENPQLSLRGEAHRCACHFS